MTQSLAAVAAALVLNWLAISSGPSAAPPPISISECWTGLESSGMLLKSNGNYIIAFKNVGDLTITSIDFRVHVGHHDVWIHDEGTFAPNVLIRHKFPNRGGEVIIVGETSIECIPERVIFDNGSIWKNSPSPAGGGI